MARRSNILVVLGMAFFVLGAAIVFLLVGDEGSAGGEPAAGRTSDGPIEVVVARSAVPAGTIGADAVSQQLVEVKRVADDDLQPGALTSTASLVGQTVAVDVPQGAQLTAAALRPTQVRGAAIAVPDGKQAVAVQLDFVPGGGGYVGTGDRVNVYSVVGGNAAAAGAPAEGGPCRPRVNLVLTDIEVLDVSREVAPRRTAEDQGQERITGNAITYLLALDASQAEQVIYLASHEDLYLTLSGAGPTPATPGPGRCAASADQ